MPSETKEAKEVGNFFAIFCYTMCQGEVLLGDEGGTPDIYRTEREAQLEIVDALQQHINQFKEEPPQREFDDLMPEWYICVITLYDDGGWTSETVDDEQLSANSIRFLRKEGILPKKEKTHENKNHNRGKRQ